VAPPLRISSDAQIPLPMMAAMTGEV
jgi:hypothetical protein